MALFGRRQGFQLTKFFFNGSGDFLVYLKPWYKKRWNKILEISVKIFLV